MNLLATYGTHADPTPFFEYDVSEGVAAMRELGRTELAAARRHLHRRVDEVRADLGLPSRRRAAYLGFVEAVQNEAASFVRAFEKVAAILSVTVVAGHSNELDECPCGWPSTEQREAGETFREHMVRDVLRPRPWP